ncbi:MAG: rod shape-determining protein MreC [Chloroflexota bacterium]|jgi:rod shape-determining protein MreC
MRDAPRRISWAAFLILMGAALLLSILDSTGNLGSALDFIRNPMAVMMQWTAGRADTLSGTLAGPRDVQEALAEIARLEAENDELVREIDQYRNRESDYQLMLELFNHARQTPDYQRITANVIGRDPNPSVRSIIIDRGLEDGLQVDMLVEAARGLVGRVYRVSNRSAQVILITDASNSVAARLVNSRGIGILRGGGVTGDLYLEWVDQRHQITVGEVVVTSGLDGRMPSDLVLGRVVEVQRSEAELFQRAAVRSAVDFNALEIVFIIVDFQPTDTGIFTDGP